MLENQQTRLTVERLSAHSTSLHVYPLLLTATQSRRAHFIGSLRAAAPMLSVVHRSAASFDLDKTIIARSSALAFGKPFRAGGLINRRAALKAAYAQNYPRLAALKRTLDPDNLFRANQNIDPSQT